MSRPWNLWSKNKAVGAARINPKTKAGADATQIHVFKLTAVEYLARFCNGDLRK